MARCPDESKLEALASGGLAGQEAGAIEEHVATCSLCAKRLAQLPIHDDLLAEIVELERARPELGPAIEKMNSRRNELTTTLFGDAGERSQPKNQG